MGSDPQMSELELNAIAARFVHARRAAEALAAFPGPIPRDLATGYAVQDRAIARWPDTLVGWKVGYIAPERRDASGEERLIGPVFREGLRLAGRDEVPFPVFDGGFAAVEAEYVFRIARDAPPDRHAWTAEQARELVDALHVGVETAGSPLASINVLGPSVVVSDFGNNAGLILGAAIADWRTRDDASLHCRVAIDGKTVGTGVAANLVGGPLGALAFALGRCARRGLPLKAGMLVTTGAATGIHDIRAGQSARIGFAGDGEIACRAVPARAFPAAASARAC